jgi:hypothetical protein
MVTASEFSMYLFRNKRKGTEIAQKPQIKVLPLIGVGARW